MKFRELGGSLERASSGRLRFYAVKPAAEGLVRSAAPNVLWRLLENQGRRHQARQSGHGFYRDRLAFAMQALSRRVSRVI